MAGTFLYSLLTYRVKRFSFPWVHSEERGGGGRIEHAERAAGEVLAPEVFSPREIPPLSHSNSRAYRSNRSKKPCGSSRLRLNDEGSMVFSSSFIIHVPFLLHPSFFPSMFPKCSTIEHSRRISRESRSSESSRLTSASMQLGRCYVMWTGKKDRGLGSLFLQGDTIFSRWTNSSVTWITN